jgi:hypothetical protein
MVQTTKASGENALQVQQIMIPRYAQSDMTELRNEIYTIWEMWILQE